MMQLQQMIGITNNCGNGNKVFFADFDGSNLEKVRQRMRELDVGDVLIMKTRKGHYWAIGFRILSSSQWMSITKKTRMCPDYKRISLERGNAVFRMTQKNRTHTVLKIVEYTPNAYSYPASFGHYYFFSSLFGAYFPTFADFKKTDIEAVSYMVRGG